MISAIDGEWKVSIFKMVDQRIKFYSQNTNLLPPKPKCTFRHLKQGIQDFWFQQTRLQTTLLFYYINTLKQELSGTKAYKETSEEEKSGVKGHCNHLVLIFLYVLWNAKTDFLQCIIYLSYTKDRIKHDLLQTQLNFLNY